MPAGPPASRRQIAKGAAHLSRGRCVRPRVPTPCAIGWASTTRPRSRTRARWPICPMWRGSRLAIAPERWVTSRTRPPNTTRHELTINADFRAIDDLITHWQSRYRGVPGARAVVEAHVREWCEQVLVEVVLASRNSSWSAEQLDALLSPTSFTAALLPRHLLHATLQKRLGQKLGTPTRHSGDSGSHTTVIAHRGAGSLGTSNGQPAERQLLERLR